MIIFVVIIGIFFTLTLVTESSNEKIHQVGILYPFSGQLAAPSPPWTVSANKNNPGVRGTPEQGLYLIGHVGGNENVPQIQCPVGYKVNIVGAFLDINDPYGECSVTPDGTLQMTCGNGTDANTFTGSCVDDSSCSPGMSCKSGKCAPSQCQSHGDCSGDNICGVNFGSSCDDSSDCSSDGSLTCVDGVCLIDPGMTSNCMACVDDTTGAPISNGQTGTCASMPLCMGIKGGLNPICSPKNGDNYHCRPRDATAYLAAHCDGKQSCLGSEIDSWDPNLPEGYFGPLPCHISASTQDPVYSQLPIISGWEGGAPLNASTINPISFSQGYYVHGIYSCVPDDENVVTTYS